MAKTENEEKIIRAIDGCDAFISLSESEEHIGQLKAIKETLEFTDGKFRKG